MKKIVFYLVLLECMWGVEVLGQVDPTKGEGFEPNKTEFKPIIPVSYIDIKSIYKFNHSGQVFVAASGDCAFGQPCYISLLEAEAGREITHIAVDYPVISLEFSEDDSMLIILTESMPPFLYSIYLWDMRTFHVRRVYSNSFIAATGFFRKNYFAVIDSVQYSSLPVPADDGLKTGEILFFNTETDSIEKNIPVIKTGNKKLPPITSSQRLVSNIRDYRHEEHEIKKYYDIDAGYAFVMPSMAGDTTFVLSHGYCYDRYFRDCPFIFLHDLTNSQIIDSVALKKDGNASISLDGSKLIYSIDEYGNNPYFEIYQILDRTIQLKRTIKGKILHKQIYDFRYRFFEDFIFFKCKNEYLDVAEDIFSTLGIYNFKKDSLIGYYPYPHSENFPIMEVSPNYDKVILDRGRIWNIKSNNLHKFFFNYSFDLNNTILDNNLFLYGNNVMDFATGEIIYNFSWSFFVDTSSNKLIWRDYDDDNDFIIWDYYKRVVDTIDYRYFMEGISHINQSFNIAQNNNYLLWHNVKLLNMPFFPLEDDPFLFLYYEHKWNEINISISGNNLEYEHRFHFNSKDELIMILHDQSDIFNLNDPKIGFVLYKLDYNTMEFYEIHRKYISIDKSLYSNRDPFIEKFDFYFQNDTIFFVVPLGGADSIFSLDTKLSAFPPDYFYPFKNKNAEELKNNQYYNQILRGLHNESRYEVDAELNGNYTILDRITNKTFITYDTIENVLGYVNNNLLLCMGTNNILKFIDEKSGDIAKMYVIGTDYIIKLENSNYYTCSKNASDIMHFQKNYQNYSFEELDPLFNRPDIVWAALGATQEVVDRYREAVEQRLLYLKLPKDISPTGNFHLPEIIVTNDPYQTITDRPDIKNLHFQVSDTSGLAYINVYVNGVPLHTRHGFLIQTPLKEAFSVDIPLGSGQNRVDMVALNRLGGRKIKTYNFFYMPPVIKPDTFYYVGIGINEYADSLYLPRLRYAVKDIRVMVESLRSVYGERLKVDTLIGSQVTKEALVKIKTRLLQSGVNDKIMVQFSGHGVTPDQEFYFPTVHSTSSDITETGIGIGLIEAFMDSLSSRNKVLLMDACESGLVAINAPTVPSVTVPADSTGGTKSIGGKAIAERQETPIEAMQRLFNDYVEGNGTTVISASSGYTSALESSAFLNGHGALTAAVLSTFSPYSSADSNKDHTLSLSELKQHVIQFVSDMTGSQQKPTIRAENLKNDFNLWEARK